MLEGKGEREDSEDSGGEDGVERWGGGEGGYHGVNQLSGSDRVPITGDQGIESS